MRHFLGFPTSTRRLEVSKITKNITHENNINNEKGTVSREVFKLRLCGGRLGNKDVSDLNFFLYFYHVYLMCYEYLKTAK